MNTNFSNRKSRQSKKMHQMNSKVAINEKAVDYENGN